MLSGALTVPPQLLIPANVRFVGAVNMDDTTHYLSPKVLDRAHVLQFQSPVQYWPRVVEEVGTQDCPSHGIRIPASHYPLRDNYPEYDVNDPVVQALQDYAREFLLPVGIELGMRPLRQAMLYRDRLAETFKGDNLQLLVLNNLLRQKLLPRFSFDGKQRAHGRGENTCKQIVEQMSRKLVQSLPDFEPFSAINELNALQARAAFNDDIFNYWA